MKGEPTSEAHEYIKTRESAIITLIMLISIISGIVYSNYSIATTGIAVAAIVTGLIVTKRWKEDLQKYEYAEKSIFINTRMGSAIIFILIFLSFLQYEGLLITTVSSAILIKVYLSSLKLLVKSETEYQRIMPIQEEGDSYFDDDPNYETKKLYKEKEYISRVEEIAKQRKKKN
jgi:hypothetical protein